MNKDYNEILREINYVVWAILLVVAAIAIKLFFFS